jgi:hypothetical protein
MRPQCSCRSFQIDFTGMPKFRASVARALTSDKHCRQVYSCRLPIDGLALARPYRLDRFRKQAPQRRGIGNLERRDASKWAEADRADKQQRPDQRIEAANDVQQSAGQKAQYLIGRRIWWRAARAASPALQPPACRARRPTASPHLPSGRIADGRPAKAGTSGRWTSAASPATFCPNEMSSRQIANTKRPTSAPPISATGCRNGFASKMALTSV